MCGNALTLQVETTVGPLLVHRRDEVITQNLVRWGLWEAAETRFLRAILRPGQTFVDVGANVGYFSVLAATSVGADGSVIAIEPESRNLALLRTNLSATPCRRVSVLGLAAYSRPAWMSLRMNETNRGDHKLAPAGETDVLVRCVRLDDVLPRVVDVVKIDTQGFDHEVIEGLVATIRMNPDVLIVSELSLRELIARDVDAVTVLERYSELGLEYSVLDGRGSTGTASADEVLLHAKTAGLDELTLVLHRA